MAAKTYPRFPLRVLRPRDQILGGTSDYYQIDEEASLIRDGFPLWDTGAGQLQAALAGNEITAFALQDPFDKNGAVLPSGSEIETFLANDPSQTWLEGNLLSGDEGAQVDHVLAQADLFAEVTLQFDPNYLGAGEPGYYFNVVNPGGGVGAIEGRGRIVSFINTRVLSNEEESRSVPGDTNAVVRVQLYSNEYRLGQVSTPVGP
jgi:hypothetical protein